MTIYASALSRRDLGRRRRALRRKRSEPFGRLLLAVAAIGALCAAVVERLAA